MNSRTEEEQIEAIKQYLQEHGTKILLVILVAITSYFSYQSWQGSKQAASETASVYYSELSMLASSTERLDESGRERFDSIFTRLADEYPSSLYAAYAGLYKAKIEVANEELRQAGQTLQWVLDNTRNADVKSLAQLRLARVQLARGEYDQALALLDNEPGPYAALYEQARGDVYLAQGQDQQALAAYRKARGLQEGAMSMSARLLDIKIENLQDTGADKLFAVAGAEINAAAGDDQAR